MSFSNLNSSSKSLGSISERCWNIAIDIGRATAKLVQTKTVSNTLPVTVPFGHNFAFTNAKFAIAGKNKTGSGKTNLEMAVSRIA